MPFVLNGIKINFLFLFLNMKTKKKKNKNTEKRKKKKKRKERKRRRRKKERKTRSSGDIIATRISKKIPIAISRLQSSMPNIVMSFLSLCQSRVQLMTTDMIMFVLILEISIYKRSQHIRRSMLNLCA